MAAWIAREGSRKGTFAHRVAYGGDSVQPEVEKPKNASSAGNGDGAATHIWDELYTTLDFDT